jgi:hypothetical protein
MCPLTANSGQGLGREADPSANVKLCPGMSAKLSVRSASTTSNGCTASKNLGAWPRALRRAEFVPRHSKYQCEKDPKQGSAQALMRQPIETDWSEIHQMPCQRAAKDNPKHDEEEHDARRAIGK